ncbi:MAG: hypothetical protein K5880_04280 [Hydrogenophaga sp.]|jgi:hypothetical protein|uniref:hypothetical protein n=1 Tax=Hydrogenophaga sp. TaxID=1904254 RepID=UPI0026302AE1|nr:hypothetical protein [Hydrogenophaga sp.]MCV0437821.1 hypothetical protein [Hydrogenophaga sp.]
MKTLKIAILSGLCAIAAGCATPGPGVPKEFPPDAQPANAQVLKERLSGRGFVARQANGTGWDMNYAADGRFAMRLSNGQTDQGRWRAEDNRVCIEFEGRFPSGCSEMRVSPSRLYLKRGSTGEVVAFDAAR